MEKNKLHVSFEDEFPTSPTHKNFPASQPLQEFPDNGHNIQEKKKSILASANNRMTSNSQEVMDTRFGEDDDDMDVGHLDDAPPSVKPNNTNKQESKSKLPVPTSGDSPSLNLKSATDGLNATNSDTKSKIPISHPEQNVVQDNTNQGSSPPVSGSKVPRYNPSKGNYQPANTNTFVDTKTVNPILNDTQTISPPIQDISNVNPPNVDSLTTETKSADLKNNDSSPKTTHSQNDISKLQKESDTTKDSTEQTSEHIPLQDIKRENNPHTESPFNRGKVPTQKGSPSNVKEPVKAGNATSSVVKDNPQSNKDAVKAKLLLHSQSNADSKIAVTESDKSEGSKPSVVEKKMTSVQNKSTNDTKDTKDIKETKDTKDTKDTKKSENEGGKDKLSVPATPSHSQTKEKKDNRFPLLNRSTTPNPPGTPRKENKLATDKAKANGSVRSREASPARTPTKSKSEVKTSKSSPNSKSKKEKAKEKDKNKEKDKSQEPVVDPVTARDVKVEGSVLNKDSKTETEEAKETADNILNELGEKPRSILARAALKKIATRNSKPGHVSGSAVDSKHVSVNERKDSKAIGKTALSVPASATGKRDGTQGDEDKLSVGSRRDSTKYSIDSMSRKSVDIRMQNHVALVNKHNEEKPKSPLAKTDSWIRSAIPYLPISVAIICLMLNILIPGTGTMVSGFAILCCGKPRVHSKDDHVIVSICVNIWVGFAQLFTITFLLVGWFWSLAWGVRMVMLSVEYRREQQVQREKQLQTMALSAFGSASNMRSLFP
ncbi:protein stum [Patella vulgata]|uniref:protein stum n=1 Tax=Patella vulgata TaxID=6465 RepID=UPI00217F8EDB|nr:protein stum [Patella vulgata]